MKLTVIGSGNMASALVSGIISNGVMQSSSITVTDTDETKLQGMASVGVRTSVNNMEASKDADVILLAVKPNIYPAVLEELSVIKGIEKKIFVTIAPGISIEMVKGYLKVDAKVIRTMPNTPAMVGEGMTVLCYESPVVETEYTAIERLFQSVGQTQLLDEKLLNSVVGVSGSSPAYVYMMIEAMADAAVYDGVPRAAAYKLAAQSVMGSAKMVLDSGKHPGELKDMVCSPGGTTIRAVQVLEEEGFRSSLMKAMIECNKKANNM